MQSGPPVSRAILPSLSIGSAHYGPLNFRWLSGSHGSSDRKPARRRDGAWYTRLATEQSLTLTVVPDSLSARKTLPTRRAVVASSPRSRRPSSNTPRWFESAVVSSTDPDRAGFMSASVALTREGAKKR